MADAEEICKGLNHAGYPLHGLVLNTKALSARPMPASGMSPIYLRHDPHIVKSQRFVTASQATNYENDKTSKKHRLVIRGELQ